jgi:hypothetical protein
MVLMVSFTEPTPTPIFQTKPNNLNNKNVSKSSLSFVFGWTANIVGNDDRLQSLPSGEPPSI